MPELKSAPALSAFQYSRIYAQGWNAARSGTAKVAARNPYPAEPEQSRWQQGYTAGLQ